MYEDADILIEYEKEKARAKALKKALPKRRRFGAIPLEKTFDPDAWNQSLIVTAPIVFEAL